MEEVVFALEGFDCLFELFVFFDKGLVIGGLGCMACAVVLEEVVVEGLGELEDA